MDEVLRTARSAADQGHARSQGLIGVMYTYGKGVQQDHVEAVRWFRKAAEQGYAHAQSMLGDNYRNDQGVKQD